MAIEASLNVIVLGPQIKTGNVFQTHEGAVRVGAQDYPAKFLWCLQPSLGPNGISKLLTGRTGRSADLTGRVHCVLLLDRINNLGDRNIELGQNVRPYPATNGVLARAENRLKVSGKEE